MTIGADIGGSPITESATAAPDPDTFQAVALAAARGLLRARKRLPPWLLYDQYGSALFEDITRLPEYYPTRTEHAILATHGDAMIAAAGPPLSIVELGAGSATKTRLLLKALLRQQTRAAYMPVDVSPAALAQAAAQLRDVRGLDVRPVVARYPEQLAFLNAAATRDAHRMVLFLGSNIGNYDPPAARKLLRGVRRHLHAGDTLLIGTDLRKAAATLIPAYDDALGVTARFSVNVLARLNRELGARFDLTRFRHVALWNRPASRMDLYLESTIDQIVPIAALGARVTFARGERIHTESSYKFTGAMVRDLVTSAGFRLQHSWRDPRRWFAVHLARVA
jgi:L-histidine N-alpha-methyltransferase